MSTDTERAFKKAAIDWLLANGQCESMTQDTLGALEDLAERGVDYDRSEMPNFQQTVIDPGNTEELATWGEALAAAIWPVGATEWHESHTFMIPQEDMQRLMFQHVLRGIVTAADNGEDAWRGKVADRLERNATRRAEREAILAARAAARSNG